MHTHSPKKKSLSRSTLLVSACTFCSRMIGFARDMLVANLFGATLDADAFVMANKIPNFLRRLFSDGAFSQAFVPVLSEYRKLKGEDEVQGFLNHISGVLALTLLIVTVIGVVAAPFVVMLFAPGFGHDDPRYELTTTMLRITFPYILFVSLAGLGGAVLNSYDKFGIPAFTPVLLNFAVVGAALWICPHLDQPVVGLAIGVFIGGVIQLFFQIPFLLRIRRLPIPRPSLKDPGVRKVMKLMAPALFGVSVGQINIMIDQWFASFLAVGSLSWLYYSDRVVQLPLGVFAVAIATVILPRLSRSHAGHEHDQYERILDWGLRSILLIALPSTLGLILYSGPIVTTLFLHGEFDANDVTMTLRSMIAFSFGLTGAMATKILASGFYAKQNIKLPVKIGIISMVANTLFSLCLVWSLEHAGLALATSLSSTLNAILLFVMLRKKQGFYLQPGWAKFLMQMAIGLVAMAVVWYFLTPSLSIWITHTTLWRAGCLAIDMSAVMAAYAAGLFFSGYRWHKL